MAAINAYKRVQIPQRLPVYMQPQQHYESPVTAYGDIISLPSTTVKGQVSGVRIKGQTWTNLAGAGDTSPQTVENLDAAKTYLLINSEGANVTIDTVDTPTPVKLTGATSFDFGWASGEIALYELSTEEATLEASVLGQKYHYVNGTKSTVGATRVKSVGKNKIYSKISDWEEGTFDSSAAKNGKEITYGANRIRSKTKYLVEPNKYYTASVSSGYEIWVLQFDKNNNRIDGTGYTYGQNIVINTLPDINYVRFTIRKTGKSYTDLTPDALLYATDIPIIKPQFEQGIIATPYEPYTESTAYVTARDSEGNIEQLRSLPNGTDEVNLTTGVKTQRIGIKENVASGTVINYADMATDGQFVAYFADGTSQTGVKGDTLTALATTLTYQLAEPVISYFPPKEIPCYPSGTIYFEPKTWDVGLYGSGITIENEDIPIKSMDYLYKINTDTGALTPVSLEDVTIAGDGLSFTITGAIDGEFYEYGYEYDRSRTTSAIKQYSTPLGVTLPIPLSDRQGIFEPVVLGRVHRLIA
jgi:hypothetical protein